MRQIKENFRQTMQAIAIRVLEDMLACRLSNEQIDGLASIRGLERERDLFPVFVL